MQAGVVPAKYVPDPNKPRERENRHSRKIASPQEPVTVRQDDAFITFFPEDTQRLTYGIDYSYDCEVIGKQWFTWAPAEDNHFRWEIAPARTFATSVQVGKHSTKRMHSCLSQHHRWDQEL